MCRIAPLDRITPGIKSVTGNQITVRIGIILIEPLTDHLRQRVIS